jgi:hypothetical protein
MATENRTPDDLQEAVAATLRRLRGEVRAPGPAPASPRVEPQLSQPLFQQSPHAAPLEQDAVEPDLLSAAGPEIPPTPAAREEMRLDAGAYAGDGVFQDQPGRARLRWVPYALSLTAIVVFAGIVWWAYQAIIGAPKGGPVPVIAADQTPAKVPPADQGASDGTDQEKTVYDQISGANTQPKSEVLLPAPETPQPPPPPATPPSPSEVTTATSPTETTTVLPPVPEMPAGTTGSSTTQPAPLTPDTGTAATTTEPTSSAQGTQQTATSTTDTGATPPAAAAAPETVDLSGVPTLSPLTVMPAAPQPDTAATTPSATTTTTADNSGTAAATTDTSQVADNFRIQLAAVKSDAEANKAWKRVLAKHGDVLGALTLHIIRADLGSQGIYYRVQAGPFADKASAKAVCDKLKAAGQQCLVKP